jgi:glycosyltransferase involved in cell wall biosynthesis
MRIGINALFHARGGSLVHLQELLGAWKRDHTFEKHQVILFGSMANIRALEANLVGASVVPVRLSDWGTAARLLVEQTVLVRSVERERIDVLFCPANTSPLRVRVPTVVSLQNAAPLCGSITVRSVGPAQWLRYRLLGHAMRLSARRARRVVFVSEHFRHRFIASSGVDRARTTVIYRSRRLVHATPHGEALLAEYKIRGRFVLAVSHLYPYKNLVELVEGFLMASRALGDPGLQLVLVGAEHFRGYRAKILSALGHRRASEGQVILTGGQPGAVVEELLARCDVFAFPSTCENCPTALIEALAAGVPIACSGVGVMPEIAGDAAIYFDPFNARDIARALGELLRNEDLRRELRRQALERAGRFPDSAEMARRTLNTLEAAIGE